MDPRPEVVVPPQAWTVPAVASTADLCRSLPTRPPAAMACVGHERRNASSQRVGRTLRRANVLVAWSAAFSTYRRPPVTSLSSRSLVTAWRVAEVSCSRATPEYLMGRVARTVASCSPRTQATLSRSMER
jgi:hypothetical protein